MRKLHMALRCVENNICRDEILKALTKGQSVECETALVTRALRVREPEIRGSTDAQHLACSRIWSRPEFRPPSFY